MERHVFIFTNTRICLNMWVEFACDYILISQIQFQPDTADEIVLVPEGKGIKNATSCMRSEVQHIPSVGKEVICL